MERCDDYKKENISDNKSKEIVEIENEIASQLPIDSLNKILPPESYIIGGAIRDIILKKSVKFSDLDVYVRCNQDEIVTTLNNLGYSETSKLPLKEKTYFFDEDSEYLYFDMDNRRVEVKFIGLARVEDLISLSDINLDCCAYDINEKCLIDKNIALSIKEKRLEFSNPELAKDDPFKVFSALKQIARFPDIEIPKETEEIIKSNIQKIYEYYVNNPNKRPKLKKLLCEINSKQVLNYFSDEQRIIFEGLEQKSSKLMVSSEYFSYGLNELSIEDFEKIQNFVKEKYGKRFDPLKLESRKVNSVILSKYEDGEIRSCCLFDGLRLYAIASSDIEDIFKMVENVIEHNRSIWTTISVDHKVLIKLSVSAGLQIEQNKEIIHKILSGQYPNYLNNTEFSEKDGYITFTRIGSGNPEQVLLRS